MAVGRWIASQSYKRVVRVSRHIAGMMLLAFLCLILWLTYERANATTIDVTILGIVGTSVIFYVAGIKGLEIYERGQGQVATASVVQTDEQTVTSVASATGPAVDAAAGDQK